MVIVESTDYGTAPEIPVKGVASIERISPGQVRISYYVVHKGLAGEREARTILHVIWDRVELLQSIGVFQSVKEEIAAAQLADGGLTRAVAH